ncbi:unnamed protein product [Polarella glacialis]|uniref:Uncharacterized protein n=1 Tax=Polarella glacialis TaxID=89957 RepID=A0A813HPQ1_POLGL|nr:unnamed protein product [Polarella glacialis]
MENAAFLAGPSGQVLFWERHEPERAWQMDGPEAGAGPAGSGTQALRLSFAVDLEAGLAAVLSLHCDSSFSAVLFETSGSRPVERQSGKVDLLGGLDDRDVASFLQEAPATMLRRLVARRRPPLGGCDMVQLLPRLSEGSATSSGQNAHQLLLLRLRSRPGVRCTDADAKGAAQLKLSLSLQPLPFAAASGSAGPAAAAKLQRFVLFAGLLPGSSELPDGPLAAIAELQLAAQEGPPRAASCQGVLRLSLSVLAPSPRAPHLLSLEPGPLEAVLASSFGPIVGICLSVSPAIVAMAAAKNRAPAVALVPPIFVGSVGGVHGVLSHEVLSLPLPGIVAIAPLSASNIPGRAGQSPWHGLRCLVMTGTAYLTIVSLLENNSNNNDDNNTNKGNNNSDNNNNNIVAESGGLAIVKGGSQAEEQRSHHLEATRRVSVDGLPPRILPTGQLMLQSLKQAGKHFTDQWLCCSWQHAAKPVLAVFELPELVQSDSSAKTQAMLPTVAKLSAWSDITDVRTASLEAASAANNHNNSNKNNNNNDNSNTNSNNNNLKLASAVSACCAVSWPGRDWQQLCVALPGEPGEGSDVLELWQLGSPRSVADFSPAKEEAGDQRERLSWRIALQDVRTLASASGCAGGGLPWPCGEVFGSSSWPADSELILVGEEPGRQGSLVAVTSSSGSLTSLFLVRASCPTSVKPMELVTDLGAWGHSAARHSRLLKLLPGAIEAGGDVLLQATDTELTAFRAKAAVKGSAPGPLPALQVLSTIPLEPFCSHAVASASADGSGIWVFVAVVGVLTRHDLAFAGSDVVLREGLSHAYPQQIAALCALESLRRLQLAVSFWLADGAVAILDGSSLQELCRVALPGQARSCSLLAVPTLAPAGDNLVEQLLLASSADGRLGVLYYEESRGLELRGSWCLAGSRLLLQGAPGSALILADSGEAFVWRAEAAAPEPCNAAAVAAAVVVSMDSHSTTQSNNSSNNSNSKNNSNNNNDNDSTLPLVALLRQSRGPASTCSLILARLEASSHRPGSNSNSNTNNSNNNSNNSNNNDNNNNNGNSNSNNNKNSISSSSWCLRRGGVRGQVLALACCQRPACLLALLQGRHHQQLALVLLDEQLGLLGAVQLSSAALQAFPASCRPSAQLWPLHGGALVALGQPGQSSPPQVLLSLRLWRRREGGDWLDTPSPVTGRTGAAAAGGEVTGRRVLETATLVAAHTSPVAQVATASGTDLRLLAPGTLQPVRKSASLETLGLASRGVVSSICLGSGRPSSWTPVASAAAGQSLYLFLGFATGPPAILQLRLSQAARDQNDEVALTVLRLVGANGASAPLPPLRAALGAFEDSSTEVPCRFLASDALGRDVFAFRLDFSGGPLATPSVESLRSGARLETQSPGVRVLGRFWPSRQDASHGDLGLCSLSSAGGDPCLVDLSSHV